METKKQISESDINTLIAACMLTSMQYSKGELKKAHPNEENRYKELERKLRDICYDNKCTLVAVSPLEKSENEQLKKSIDGLLETGSSKLSIKQISELKKQRDELLEALRYAVTHGNFDEDDHYKFLNQTIDNATKL